MDIVYIIMMIFFIAFFIESIFGFGGLVISFALLGFFIDIKHAVYLGLYIGIIGSIFILISDYKSLSLQRFREMFVLAFIGVIIGTFIFDFFSSDILLKIFSIFLCVFAVKNLFFPNLNPTTLLFKNSLLFSGGLLQGIFGTGGPFSVLAMKNSFKNKSELRTTMALFFIFFNIVRGIQLWIQGNFEYQIIIDYYWLAFVLLGAIILGYQVHVKISERFFHLGINYILLISSILLFFKG
ncbi:sulfite exporter TauE/SafE family protein [Candidatus Gracilibacteria bacterium]|nr:sulfite exporter TauE/SafE family protein [Candidatus Gracilibacteria bacterium]